MDVAGRCDSAHALVIEVGDGRTSGLAFRRGDREDEEEQFLCWDKGTPCPIKSDGTSCLEGEEIVVGYSWVCVDASSGKQEDIIGLS